MVFDFGRVAAGNSLSTIIDPSEIFDALPTKAKGYGYLRAVQKAVLDGWMERRTDRDVVIKINTGGGKTIVGLLILQSCLHEGVGPALYLAPDPHLAGHVRDEALMLGLSVVSSPDDPKFLRGEAICVTTMQTLLNGKSRFGLAVPGSRPVIRTKAIVVDDAHAALALSERQSRLTIARTHESYIELLTIFDEDLKSQNPNALWT
jgi:replicative superfamily II helicase